MYVPLRGQMPNQLNQLSPGIAQMNSKQFDDALDEDDREPFRKSEMGTKKSMKQGFGN